MNIKIIDLFAGMGGFRIGITNSASKLGLQTNCVMASDIKHASRNILKENFNNLNLMGDICQVESNNIPDFDILMAGFPCQPFSSAGKGHGFLDTRGTLFFEIERILSEKRPDFFILENVEGLVVHDLEKPKDKIGRTLKTILKTLNSIGYKTTWKVIDSSKCGVPQIRKRIYIVGSLFEAISLDDIESGKSVVPLKNILEKGLPVLDTKFTKQLLKHYQLDELKGKSIKDKRGGSDNIHSWDFGLKGEISKKQKCLLNMIFKERRRKIWAEQQGITWMDGMPLTFKQIKTFYNEPDLKMLLKDLCEKGYLKYEYPKELLNIEGKKVRVHDSTKEKGYNIVSGKLSFPITKILDPMKPTPTLVATDLDRLAVVEENGLRSLSRRECLRLCGYPDSYLSSSVNDKEFYDLIGNTVVVSVVEKIADKIVNQYIEKNFSKKSSNKFKNKEKPIGI